MTPELVYGLAAVQVFVTVSVLVVCMRLAGQVRRNAVQMWEMLEWSSASVERLADARGLWVEGNGSIRVWDQYARFAAWLQAMGHTGEVAHHDLLRLYNVFCLQVGLTPDEPGVANQRIKVRLVELGFKPTEVRGTVVDLAGDKTKKRNRGVIVPEAMTPHIRRKGA